MRWGFVKERSFGRPDWLFGQYTPIISCCREAVCFMVFCTEASLACNSVYILSVAVDYL